MQSIHLLSLPSYLGLGHRSSYQGESTRYRSTCLLHIHFSCMQPAKPLPSLLSYSSPAVHFQGLLNTMAIFVETIWPVPGGQLVAACSSSFLYALVGSCSVKVQALQVRSCFEPGFKPSLPTEGVLSHQYVLVGSWLPTPRMASVQREKCSS